MSNSAVEITKLLYRYAECIDTGDLEGAAGTAFGRERELPRSGEAT